MDFKLLSAERYSCRIFNDKPVDEALITLSLIHI